VDQTAQKSGHEFIGDRIANREERIHINLGPVCNNNCVFCMEEDRTLRYEVNSAITPARVKKILQQNAGAAEVCFTSGEPTLVRELPGYVHWARQLRYDRISVMTNGRRLSQMSYAEGLVKAGMNCFYISIHGNTRKMHDALVRTPGAFEQTLAGLDNVARLLDRGVILHTSTVVNHRNIDHFAEIYSFLRAHGVQQVVFNVMQANGRADTYFDQLFPTYTLTAEKFAAFVETSDEPEAQAFLVDIPLCITHDRVPDFQRGYVERYVHFEVAPEDGIARDPASARARQSDDGEFLEVARSDLDAVAREKRAECADCRYNQACEGVWTNYIRRMGWDEFVPVPK